MSASQPSRNQGRTKHDIKRALLELLRQKSRDQITMSELAREAQISRSTLYQHYGNVYDVYMDVIADFDRDTAPHISKAKCFEHEEAEGVLPFCELLRSEKWRNIVDSPCFLSSYIHDFDSIGNPHFLEVLSEAGYPNHVARALAFFQINGCYSAVRQYGQNEQEWQEIREVIDTFICGGLEGCRKKGFRASMRHSPASNC